MNSRQEPQWKNPEYPTTPKGHWESLNIRTGKTEPCEFNSKTAWRNLIAERFFCPPEGGYFLNPLRIDGVGEKIFARWKRSQIRFALFGGFLAVMLYMGHAGGDRGFVAVMALLALLIGVNLATSRSASELADKSEFLTHVAIKGRKRILFPLLMAAISFAASQFLFGTFDDAAYAYGALIEKVDAFQWWRLVTGPFIHYTLTAWLLNNVLLALIYPLASHRSVKYSTILFLAGSTFSEVAYVSMANMGFPHQHLMVGFSGGIFALLGFVQIDSIFASEYYPKRFWALVASFILLNLIGAQILVSHVSLTAHISGFCLGVLTSLIFVHSGSTNQRNHRSGVE